MFIRYSLTLLAALVFHCAPTYHVIGADPRKTEDKETKDPLEIEILSKRYEVTVSSSKGKNDLKYVPGYIDPRTNTFYALKGISFDRCPDKFDPYHRTLELVAGKHKYGRREVELPVAYLTVGKDRYAPGLYATRWGQFYRWKGILLTADELPEKDPKKPYTILPEKPEFHRFYEIPAPKYLLDKPELWKKVKKVGK